jgi:hypothetical protein
MRPRKLKLVVKVAGFKMPLASVKIKKYADVIKPKTELICPQCGNKPQWDGKYLCRCCPLCGKTMEAVVVDEKGTINYKCSEHGWQDPTTYKHWSQLKRVLPDGREIVKPKLTSGEDVEAEVYVMDKAEFSKYADATLTEYGIVVQDSNSALNLKKLLVALNKLNKVIIIHYNDTYEEKIAVLTISLSNRVVLKELIPLNIADIRETMKVDFTGITDSDIAEAEALVNQLPKAEEQLFYVNDYRTIGVETPKVSPKVLQLEAIIEKMAKEKAVT